MCAIYFTLSLERKIWEYGADKYLIENKGWNFTASLLKKSLSDNPGSINFDNSSYPAKLIKNSVQFQSVVNKYIPVNGDTTFSIYSEDHSFERDGTIRHGDLFAAIHNYRVALNGTKNTDGTWTIKATIADVFDFTEFVTPNEPRFRKDLASAFLWTANDVAYLDSKLGVIKPVKYYIEFTYSHPAKE